MPKLRLMLIALIMACSACAHRPLDRAQVQSIATGISESDLLLVLNGSRPDSVKNIIVGTTPYEIATYSLHTGSSSFPRIACRYGENNVVSFCYPDPASGYAAIFEPYTIVIDKSTSLVDWHGLLSDLMKSRDDRHKPFQAALREK